MDIRDLPRRPDAGATETQWRFHLHSIIRWLEEGLDAEDVAHDPAIREGLQRMLAATLGCMHSIGAMPTDPETFAMQPRPDHAGLLRQLIDVARFALNTDTSSGSGFSDACLAFSWVARYTNIAYRSFGCGGPEQTPTCTEV